MVWELAPAATLIPAFSLKGEGARGALGGVVGCCWLGVGGSVGSHPHPKARSEWREVRSEKEVEKRRAEGERGALCKGRLKGEGVRVVGGVPWPCGGRSSGASPGYHR